VLEVLLEQLQWVEVAQIQYSLLLLASGVVQVAVVHQLVLLALVVQEEALAVFLAALLELELLIKDLMAVLEQPLLLAKVVVVVVVLEVLAAIKLTTTKVERVEQVFPLPLQVHQ
jgi:hypothetical protein